MTLPDDTIIITFAIICNEWLRTLTYLCKLTVVLLAGFVTQNLEHFPQIHSIYLISNLIQKLWDIFGFFIVG